MNIEEEILKRIAPELYAKIIRLEHSLNSMKADFDVLRESLSSSQASVMQLHGEVSEMRGRYAGIEETVITKIENRYQQFLISILGKLLSLRGQ